MTPNSNLPRVPENASDEHEFHVLGPKRFEHLVRALHEAQPDMYGSHLYGPDGQGQFGADHIAYRRTNAGPLVEVGQSKAYRDFGASQIAKAAKDFLDHWEDHWEPKKVRRFILFIGCAIKSEKAHAEIMAQVQAFALRGLEFCVWDANTIYDRLGEAPGVVRRHLSQQWYARLFGEPVGPLTGLVRDLQRGDRGALQVGGYVARLNQAESAELVEFRRRARRGERTRVIDDLDNLLSGPQAAATAPEVRAGQLRLLAGLFIQEHDLIRARDLLDQADALDGDSRRQRAILMLEAVGPAAALADIEPGEDSQLSEIRAIARLRQGDPASAFAELDAHLAADDPSAETLRIAALAKLVGGARGEALDLARRAAARDFDSRACSQTLALCHFHLALSPATEPMVGEWPHPIDLPLVRASDEARSHLEEAAAGFGRLMADEALDEHKSMVMWHLATMACMPWRRAETEARIAELQAAGKFPIPMTAWCVSRGLEFDAAAAVAACDAQLILNPDDFETLLVRVALATSGGDHKLARELLKGGRESLVAAGHGAIHDYWSAVIDMETRGSASAASVDGHPWLALRSAMDVHDRKKRLKRIAALLGKQLAQQGDARVILASAQLLLEGGWHKAAAKAASFLLDKVATAEAIAVAVHALYRTGRSADAVKALGCVDAFPGKALPADLARLRAECLAVSGDLVGARQASLELARTTGAAKDLWRSIEFHIATGAAPAALALYEEHEALLERPGRGHVMLANALVPTHPDAAARITRHIATDAPDRLVTAAFSLASKLRLGDEQRLLIGRIQQLGNSGAADVRMISIDQIVEMVRTRREQAEQAFEKYANGHVPVHFLAEIRQAALAITYLAPLVNPLPPQTRSAILSARYGRRYDEGTWPSDLGDARLLVDVTALMTAQALDLLDTVERTFKPVMIGPDTVNAVISLRSDVEVVQPERVAATRRVVSHCDQGRIAIADGAPQFDAFNVLWELKTGETASTLNFSRMAETLLSPLRADEVERARTALGNTIDEPASGATPSAKAVLNIDGTMAVTLEETGLLNMAADRFAVTLPADELDRLRGEIADADMRAGVVGALSALAARLARGLDDGTYQTVPVVRLRERNIVTRSFLEIVHAMRDGSGILWTDDRFISSVDNPKFRTVTTVEVLGALCRRGRITRTREIELRQQLRAARYQFLGILADEVAVLLRQATRNGEVEETSDLAILRRHAGEFLQHRRRLQWPPPSETDHGIRAEVPHLLDNGHEVAEALAAIWNDETWLLEDARAASEWILDNLEVGLFPLPVLGPCDPRSDQLIGTHLGSLVLTALRVQPGARTSLRQKAYLEWISDGLLRNSLRMRPEFREPMESMVEAHLVRDNEGKPEEKLWLELAGRMMNAMPEAMRFSMFARKGLREGFDLPDHGAISVDGHDFDELEFWEATAHAGNSPPPTLKSQADAKATMRLVDGDDRHLLLQVSGTDYRLNAWAWAIAHSDHEVRAEALGHEAVRLDLGLESMVALNAALAQMEPVERIRHVRRRQQATAANWYADLQDSIEKRVPFKVADLVPQDLASVVHYMRFNQDMEAAAGHLIAEHGLAVALRRLGALPIIPPRSIATVLEAMDDDALATLLDDAEADTAAPWTQLFIARMVAGRSGGAGALYERLRGWIDDALGEAAVPLWGLYVALARFTCAEGAAQPSWRAMDARRQLATSWAHAGSVVEIVLGGGVKVDPLLELVNENRFVSPGLLLEPVTALDQDTTNPRRLNSSRAMSHAAAPALTLLAGEPDSKEWAHGHLRSLARKGGEELQNARISIAEGGLLQGDLLSSYLATDHADLFEGAAPGTGALFGRGLVALVASVLAAEAERTQPTSGWPFVRFASGDVALPPDLAEEARRVAELPKGEDGCPDPHGLHAFAQLATANGWSEHREAIGVAVQALTPADLDPETDPMVLVEMAVLHAMMEADLLARTAILGGHLRRLVRHEELRESVTEVARHFARGLPGQYAEAFVDVLADAWSSR